MNQKAFASLPEGTHLVMSRDLILKYPDYAPKGAKLVVSYGGKWAGSSPKRRQCTVKNFGRFWIPFWAVELEEPK